MSKEKLDYSPPYLSSHETPVAPGRWIPKDIDPDLFERSVRRFEKYDRGGQPYPALREFYTLPMVTAEELEAEKQAEMKAVLDNFWLNDKE